MLNYARLMPVHLAQMNALVEDNPETWNALKFAFVLVAKSEIPFTHLFSDQALEPRVGSGVVRMDPLRFLAGCRTRRLNQV